MKKKGLRSLLLWYGAQMAKSKFKTESEMCAAFQRQMKACGWRVFPETSGFDILLVAGSTARWGATWKKQLVEEGLQIGVEAKLRPNIKVLYQSLPMRHGARSGPDFHMVLTPTHSSEFVAVAGRLGILVASITPEIRFKGDNDLRMPPLFPFARCLYSEPCWVPGVEVEMSAGAASPRTISPWKLKAVRFCIEAEKRDFVTASDFAEAGLSASTFVRQRWFVVCGKIGRYNRYQLNRDAADAPHRRFPEVAAAIRAANARK